MVFSILSAYKETTLSLKCAVGRAVLPAAPHCALNLKGFKTDYTQSPELLLFIAALGAHALFV